MSDTVTVYHPTLDGIVQEVAKADLDRWVEQGWKKSQPKSAEPVTEATEAEQQ